jgi:hypothetical protein
VFCIFQILPTFLLLTVHDHPHPEDASLVLQEILKNLPEKPVKTISYGTPHKITQYDIPSDPIPPFKPLKSHGAHSVYGPPLAISHSHTLTTSYGTPAVDQYHKYFDHKSDGSNLIPSVVPKYKDSNDSHSIWHKMTLKMKKTASPEETKEKSNGLIINSNTNENDLHKTIVEQALGKNTDIEIQKSIQYEIKESDYKKQ